MQTPANTSRKQERSISAFEGWDNWREPLWQEQKSPNTRSSDPAVPEPDADPLPALPHPILSSPVEKDIFLSPQLEENILLEMN